MFGRLHLLVIAISLGACTKDRSTTHAGDVTNDGGPDVDEVHYVSSDRDDDAPVPERSAASILNDGAQAALGDEFAVQSPERALELAEAAVADELDPKHTWKASPILPAKWPAHDQKVLYFFYPMANSPNSLSHYQLYSPAWAVEVSLVDGTTQVRSVAKQRRLGVIEERRPGLSERQELELAENTLVELLLVGETAHGDNNFWGYLKYFHENPKFAGDIKTRSPQFVRWLYAKKR